MVTADGKDISSLVEGTTDRPVREIAVTENPWSRTIRMGNYRLVYTPKETFAEEFPDGYGELYDLESDPWEMNNLYFKEDSGPIVARMMALFVDWLHTTTRVRTVNGLSNERGWQYRKRYGRTVAWDGKVPFEPFRDAMFPLRNYL
jgi:choline-sulfatase/uncharacterized sulfatase